MGYELGRDLRTCQRVAESLLFSAQNSIRGIALNANMITETRPPVIMQRFTSARAIDVDYANNITFFYDPIRRAILQNKLSGSYLTSTTEILGILNFIL